MAKRIKGTPRVAPVAAPTIITTTLAAQFATKFNCALHCTIADPGCPGGDACDAHQGWTAAVADRDLDEAALCVLLGAGIHEGSFVQAERSHRILDHPSCGPRVADRLAQLITTATTLPERFAAVHLRIAEVHGLERRTLLRLAASPALSGIAMLSMLEQDHCDDEVVATALSCYAKRGQRDVDLETVFSHWCGDAIRTAAALVFLGAPSEPRPLLKSARRALNRMNHCRADGLMVLETLATSWDGVADDLVDTAVDIMGHKRPR